MSGGLGAALTARRAGSQPITRPLLFLDRNQDPRDGVPAMPRRAHGFCGWSPWPGSPEWDEGGTQPRRKLSHMYAALSACIFTCHALSLEVKVKSNLASFWTAIFNHIYIWSRFEIGYYLHTLSPNYGRKNPPLIF